MRKALGVETRPDSQVLFFVGVKEAIALLLELGLFRANSIKVKPVSISVNLQTYYCGNKEIQK